MPLLDELLVVLGFEYDPKEVKKFNEDIAATVDIIKRMSRIAVAGASAITGLTIASTKASALKDYEFCAGKVPDPSE